MIRSRTPTRLRRAHPMTERVGLFKRPCLSCGKATRATRCPACEGLAYSGSTLTASGSTRRWRTIRHLHLVSEPLCRDCLAEGRATPATEVDHIQARIAGGTDNDSNLRSLCREHHQQRGRA